MLHHSFGSMSFLVFLDPVLKLSFPPARQATAISLRIQVVDSVDVKSVGSQSFGWFP